MSTATIVVKGLCLWLTASGGAQGIIPDFAAAVPSHIAIISLARDQTVEGTCPPLFHEAGASCLFTVNGMGLDGGVQIELSTDPLVPGPPDINLCEIPHIQHQLPLTLRPVYAPPSGARIAAQLRVARGKLTGRITAQEGCVDCARLAEYSLTAPSEISLRLSNLRFREPITVRLRDNAQILVRNERPDPFTPVDEVADWCLYFTMFEEAGCPGAPLPPECPTGTATAESTTSRQATRQTTRQATRQSTRRTTQHAHADGQYTFETIACSNSQYP